MQGDLMMEKGMTISKPKLIIRFLELHRTVFVPQWNFALDVLAICFCFFLIWVVTVVSVPPAVVKINMTVFPHTLDWVEWFWYFYPAFEIIVTVVGIAGIIIWLFISLRKIYESASWTTDLDEIEIRFRLNEMIDEDKGESDVR